jgi:hypothetical protein
MTIISTRNQLPKFLQPDSIITTTEKSNIKSSLTILNSSRTEQRRRNVAFKDTVSVRPITHVKDLSEEMIRTIWYNKKDFEDMKKSFASTVRIMSQIDPNIDNEEHCSRGLEYRTRVGANARRENKWNALNAVLDEQDRQQEMGVSNEKLLCQLYVTDNCICRLKALKLGIQDEKIAKTIYLESKESPNEEMTDMSSNSESSDDVMDYCQAYQPIQKPLL